MAKTVEISFDSIKQGWADLQVKVNDFLAKAQSWLTDYFGRIDTYGMIAVGAIGIGFILFIVGLIIL